jgi:replicative DNA helicase
MSQLSRDVEKRSGNEVFFKNSDLRDSGALEQDADTIMFLDRQIGCSESVLYVTKNRGGKVGVVRLNFEQDYTTFTDVRFRDSKETTWNEDESASE